MRRLILVALTLLPVACNRLGSSGGWYDTHTLKMYENKEGEVVRVTRARSATFDATATAGCRGATGQWEEKEKLVFTEEMLGANRLRRKYEVVEETDLNGRDLKSLVTGKTVEIDLSGPKPAYTIDAKPPTDEQAKELDREFAVKTKDMPSSAEMLPDHPVKVGEWWTADKIRVADFMPDVKGAKFAVDQARLKGKLVRVTQLGGRPRATVEFTLTIPVREYTPAGMQRLKTDKESTLVVTQTVEFWSDASGPEQTILIGYRGRVGAELPGDGLFTYHYNGNGTTVIEPASKK